MRFVLAIAALAILLIAVPGAARAQTTALSPLPIPPAVTIPGDPATISPVEDTMALLAKLPPEIQKQLINESIGTKLYCENNTMLSNFYDCSCVSLQMMRARIDNGPNVPIVNMIQSANLAPCVSLPAVAGYSQQRCTQTLVMSSFTTEKMNGICDCAARTVAHRFGEHPVPDMRFVDNTFAQSLTDCHVQAGF